MSQNTPLAGRVAALAQHFHADTVALRRHLHAHPELSYEEVETGRYIAARLAEWGIPHTHGIAGNGIVALIEGQQPGNKVLALRADIDALPIEEANAVPYRSQRPGVMHACGHDAHSASLLGAARILHALRGQFGGTVKLLFQPAEEKLPGGASLMIAEGALENPAPSSIVGQHVYPQLEAGKVGLRGGMYMASADELYVTVHGRGGHGAVPQDCVDPIAITAQIISALQQLVSRQANPTIPSVLTFGKINSTGGATNIIPDAVKLEGTFRTMDEAWREQAHAKMRRMAEHIAEGMGGHCDFRIERGYPALINDPALTEEVRQYAIEFLGAEQVVELPIRMTAEDFAYYSQVMPACFYRLGTGNPAKGITSALHTATFDIDESALNIGAGLMAYIALRQLGA